MARLYMIRHGRAAQNWDVALDPPLDELGRQQAEMRAQALAAELAPLPIVTSPLRRCRETAAFLAERWQTTPSVEARVREIPSPDGMEMAARRQWLPRVLAESWNTLPAEDVAPLTAWREDLLRALHEYTQDVVIFSHFVATNVAVGVAQNDERLVSFFPANASCTLLETDGQTLRLLKLGEEDRSVIS